MKIEPNSYLKFSTLIKEQNTGYIYLDTPDLPKLEPQVDDIEYIIEEHYHRRPDKIAEEILAIMRNEQAGEITFADDIFTLDRGYVVEFCNFLKDFRKTLSVVNILI